MVKLNYRKTHFLTSVSNIQYLPIDTGIEIAFIGRSNVGKSSILNILTNKKKLARISKIPGCTQTINLFEVEKGKRLVDLPGYGYAKVSKVIKKEWKQNLTKYMEQRLSLKGFIIVMDIRHPLMDFDKKIIKQAIKNNILVLILLSKADTLSKEKRNIQLNEVRKIVSKYNRNVQIEIFSSFKNYGVNKLIQKMNEWYKRD